MSSRQLRKLQKQRELEAAQTPEENSEEELSEPELRPKPKVSLFAALGGEDEDEDEDEDKDDDQGVKLTPETPSREEEAEDSPQLSSSKKSKKKKKKKAKQAKVETPEPVEDDGQDEIDKALKELNLAPRRGPDEGQESTTSYSRRLDQLLGINTHHLKAINEMRQLFGRDIIESATAEEQEEAANARRARGTQNVDLEGFIRSFSAQGRKLPEVSLRRNPFIQGKDHWPLATTGGLTLKAIGMAEGEEGATEYAYVHEKDYDAVQALFFSLVQVGDPMRMVYLMREARESHPPPHLLISSE
jgi:hypothetical protein